jgi:hypothetical protein
MPRTHNATGRTFKDWKTSRQTKRNRPPQGESWIWLTADMLESAAWRSMSLNARKIVDRLIVEHLAHAGTENGNLITTYSDFQQFGLRRRSSIAPAIIEAETLGIIDVIERGGSAYAEFRNPSRYALAWLDRKDGTPPTNRWKTFETMADASKAVSKALDEAAVKKASHKNKKPVTKSPRTGVKNVTSAGHKTDTSLNNQPVTNSGLLSISPLGAPQTTSTVNRVEDCG